MFRRKISHNTKRGVLLSLMEAADMKTFLFFYKLVVKEDAKRHQKGKMNFSASWDMEKLRRIEELEKSLDEINAFRSVELTC